MKVFIFFHCFFFCGYCLFSIDYCEYYNKYKDVFEEEGGQIACELLYQYEASPMRLNEAKIQELINFPLFNRKMAAVIFQYRKQRQGIKHLEELLHLPGFNADLLHAIRPLVRLGKIAQEKALQVSAYHSVKNSDLGKADFVSRGNLRIDHPKKKVKAILAYDLDEGEHIQQFFKGDTSMSLKFCSIRVQDESKIIKDFVLGSHAILLGKGLVCNTTNNRSLMRFKYGGLPLDFRCKTGSYSVEYERRNGLYFDLGKSFGWRASISRSNVIANVETLEGVPVIRSFNRSGRNTFSEKEKHVDQQDWANQWYYRYNKHKWSINHSFTLLDTPYRAKKSYYNTAYPTGRRFQNYSLSYASYADWGLVSMELAIDQHGDLAAEAELHYTMESDYTWAGILKYYSSDYQSFLGSSSNKGTFINDEFGINVLLSCPRNGTVTHVIYYELMTKKRMSFRRRFPTSQQLLNWRMTIRKENFKAGLSIVYSSILNHAAPRENNELTMHNTFKAKLNGGMELSSNHKLLFELQINALFPGSAGGMIGLYHQFKNERFRLDVGISTAFVPSYDNRFYSFFYHDRFSNNMVLHASSADRFYFRFQTKVKQQSLGVMLALAKKRFSNNGDLPIQLKVYMLLRSRAN